MRHKAKQSIRRGYTMVAVICVTALICAFSLGILASASTLYASSRSRISSQVQCKAIVNAVLDVLDRSFEELPSTDGTSATGNLLVREIFYQIEGQQWPYYNAAKLGHTAGDTGVVRSFAVDLSTADTDISAENLNNLGTVHATLRWEDEDEGLYSNSGYRELIVTVTCEINGVSYSLSSRFGRLADVEAGGTVWHGKWQWLWREA